MRQRILVTTAIEKTWDDNVENIFLGSWCKRFSRRKKWSLIKHKTIAYHWDDRIKLEKDYYYLNELYEEYLLIVSDYLNNKHHTKHSLIYWRILIGPWLGYFIHLLYDRWYMLIKGMESYNIDHCNILNQDSLELVVNDMDEFMDVCSSDEWNENIYSQILLIFFKDRIVLNKIEPDKKSKEEQTSNKFFSFEVKKSLLSKFLGVNYKNCRFFFFKTYLPRIVNIKTQALLGQFPKIWIAPPLPFFRINKKIRQYQLENNGTGDFSKVLSHMLIKNIPKVYLEGYKELIQMTNNLKWPKKPKIIFTATAFHTDEIFKAWSAQKVENGSKMITIQHGGMYGMTPFNFAEDLQVSLSHRVISWGYSYNSKTIPFGNIKTIGVNVKPINDGFILLVCYSWRVYSQYIQCHPIAGQVEDYFEDQLHFIDELSESIRNNLKIRLFPRDHGHSTKKRVEEKFTNICIDSGENTLYSMMKQSRLVVVDANETTYLEALSLNIPTVIFWKKELWEINEEAKPYFERLKEAGVFHDTPESAARHVCNIWEEITLWWESEETKDAVELFCNNYCANIKNPSINLAKILSKFAE